MAEREVRLMLLVGSNGKSAACVEGTLGWGDLADSIMDWHGNKCTDPEASVRYFISVNVSIPEIGTIVAEARPSKVEE